MAQATFHFPRGFLWGTATAAHQVEGNNTNNSWWAWEQESGHILNGHKSGLACDWWGGRWREDLDRAAESGQNAHRFSIEWSRVQPRPDHWDEDAVERYRQIARGLHERRMTPLVTLHHFSDPLWLLEMGGWEDEGVVEQFEKYVSKVVEALKEYVNLWLTINEPFLFTSFGYILGIFPPGKKDMKASFRVAANLVRAHAAAYRAIHRIQPQARVSIVNYYLSSRPLRRWSPLDGLVTWFNASNVNDSIPYALSRGILRFLFYRQRIPEAKGTLDFLGIDYYTRMAIAFNLLKPGDLFTQRMHPPQDELSENGFIANQPDGIYEAIKWGLQFNLPIIITENGVEDASDQLRPRYLVQHLHQVWRAVNFNHPVKGYFHWTLVDNFEWDRGWTQRFGLWALDVATQVRTKRPSANLYAEICRENGISSEMVARYAPALLEKMFPG